MTAAANGKEKLPLTNRRRRKRIPNSETRQRLTLQRQRNKCPLSKCRRCFATVCLRLPLCCLHIFETEHGRTDVTTHSMQFKWHVRFLIHHQAPVCHCGEKAHARKNRDPKSPWHGAPSPSLSLPISLSLHPLVPLPLTRFLPHLNVADHYTCLYNVEFATLSC